MKLNRFCKFILILILSVLSAGVGQAESRAVVTGQTAEIDKKNNVILLRGNVKADNPTENMHLEAEQLILKKDPLSDEVIFGEAEEQVVIIRNGVKVRTQYAIFDKKKGKAELNQGVRIDSSEYQLIGNRLQYNLSNQTGKVTALPQNQVKIKFYGTPSGHPKPRNEIQGISDEILIYELSKKMILQGNVHLEEFGFPNTPKDSPPAMKTEPEQKKQPEVGSKKQIKSPESPERVPMVSDKNKLEDETFQLAYDFEPEEEPIINELQINTPEQKEAKQAPSEVKHLVGDKKRILISQFDAQRAEVFLNKQDEVDVIIASGDVVIMQNGRTSKAQKAVFDYNTEIIRLIEDAYVKEEGQVEVTSSYIEMHMNVSKGMIKGKKESPVKIEIPVK